MRRRAYLMALGAATASLAGCSSGSSSSGGTPAVLQQTAITRRFDGTIDVLEASDCDPSGETDCASAIETAARSGHLLRFPSGDYRLDRPVELAFEEPVGLAGDGGATLRPARGFNGMAVSIDAPEVLFEGFDIDLGRPNTTAGVTVAADSWFRVGTVTYRGRGDHDGESSPFAFNLAVRNRDGAGSAIDLQARHGAAIGHYKSGGGRGGIWIGPANKGTIRIENGRFEEFANNGVYASRTNGNVEIVGGVYRNNNVASLRFGGEGSFVRDARIEVDLSSYDGPRTQLESAFATRGIVIEQGPKTDSKPPGASVRDCEIDLHDSPGPGAGISVWSTGRTLAVSNTSIHVGIDDYTGIFRAPRVALDDRPPSGFPRGVTLENVTIDGRAHGTTAVRLADAPESTIDGCQIEQRESDNVALHLVRSPDVDLRGGKVHVSGPVAVLEELASMEAGRCLLRVSGSVDARNTASRQSDRGLESVDGCLSLTQLVEAGIDALEVLGISDDRIVYRVRSG